MNWRFWKTAMPNNKAQLVVLYGRRRVGKTELLAQFRAKQAACVLRISIGDQR